MGVRIESDVPGFAASGNVRLTNGWVDVVASTSFGPRVLAYGPSGGPNLLGGAPDGDAKETPFGEVWRLYGGHRLWYAPEDPVRTYFPDNAPIRCEVGDGSVTLIQAVEPHSGLEKAISLELDGDSSRLRILHRITNRGAEPATLALWALTMMRLGGEVLIPNAPFVPHPIGLLPSRPLVLWPYTNLGDSRYRFGSDLLHVRHDASASGPTKVGLYDEQGWAAYATGDLVFLKRFETCTGEHADLGCNVEVFTSPVMLELETLGPLVVIEPGGSRTHRETWGILRGELPSGDADARRVLVEALSELGL